MAVVGVSSGLLVGCDLGSGPPPIPSSLEAAAGLDQTATVVTPVPIPPAVRVLNKRGRPMRGREVVFFVASGGGQVSGNVSLTDQEGIARVGTWILGPTAGDQTLQAHVPELPPLTFTATGTAASPASIIGNGGGGQTGMVGSTLDLKPSVLVKDVYGNPVDGAAIGFEVTEGGGFLSQTMALTDASGIAESGSWTLGVTQGPKGFLMCQVALRSFWEMAKPQPLARPSPFARPSSSQTGSGTSLKGCPSFSKRGKGAAQSLMANRPPVLPESP